MSDYLVSQISENRDGTNSSSSEQISETQKTEEATSQTITSRSGEKVFSDVLGGENRTQDRTQTEETIRSETQNQSSTNTQNQTRNQTQNTTQTRNLTAQSDGQESNVEMADIGSLVKFSVKIRGGLGTVPEGITPPAPIC